MCVCDDDIYRMFAPLCISEQLTSRWLAALLHSCIALQLWVPRDVAFEEIRFIQASLVWGKRWVHGAEEWL